MALMGRDPQEAAEIPQALAVAVRRREFFEAARTAYRALEEDERLRFFLDIAEEILGTTGLTLAALSTRKATEPSRNFLKPIKYGKAEIERVAALAALGMEDTQIAAELGLAISVVERLKAAGAHRAPSAIRLVKQEATPAPVKPPLENDPKCDLATIHEHAKGVQVEEDLGNAGVALTIPIPPIKHDGRCAICSGEILRNKGEQRGAFLKRKTCTRACNRTLRKEIGLLRQERLNNLIRLVDHDGKPVAPAPAPAPAPVLVPAPVFVPAPVLVPVLVETGGDPHHNTAANATPRTSSSSRRVEVPEVQTSASTPALVQPLVPSRGAPILVLQPELEGKAASKQTRLCSRCHQLGHNARTCPTRAESAPHALTPKKGEAPKKPKKAAPGSAADSPEIYFKQIRSLDLLTKDDELELSKHLEETETAAWQLLLESPEAPAVIARVRDIFTKRVPASEESAAEERAGLPDFTSSAELLATVLRKLDHERVYSTAVLGVVVLDDATLRQFHALQREATTVRDHFIKSNLRLVISMARKWRSSGVPMPDLIQEGNLGLMHAVPRYDHRKGFRFSTFAVWWIRHAISRFIHDKRSVVRVPVNQHETSSKVHKQRTALTAKLGRDPTLEELSEVMQLSTQKLAALANVAATLRAPISLDAPGHAGADGDSPKLLDRLVDPGPSIPEDLIAEESRRRVTAALAVLPAREAAVLRKRFGIGSADQADQEGVEMTLAEIGDECSLSRERIRQLEKQALVKLRQALERE